MNGKKLLPGSTLGVLGGGQLGRMFALQALQMGYKVVVLDPDSKSPAGLIASEHLCAAYDDESALQQMVEQCDACTIEFENIPLQSLDYVATRCFLSPRPDSVAIAQDRLKEKAFFKQHELATARCSALAKLQDVQTAINITGFPAILKTARLGYDGKGQQICNSIEDVITAYSKFGEVDCILEQMVDLKTEVSVVLARSVNGDISVFPVAENTHVNGILDVTTVPAEVPDSQQQQAHEMACKLAKALNYVGVLAVEIFITQDGQVLINEIAPRPHNSGHYTLDATQSSQFEQQIRMMCNLPAASTELMQPIVMLNLLGDSWGETQPDWATVLQNPNARLHLYAKEQAKPGRKMGHINMLGSDTQKIKKDIKDLKQALIAK